MAIRSVEEIINLSDSSQIPEKLAFEDLVKHIDPRIRERAPRHNSLHFKIPGILWGQPVFDAKRVEKMIYRHYKSIGFKCTKLDDREIIIKWGKTDSEHSDQSSGQGDTSSKSSGSSSDTEGSSSSDTESGSDTDSISSTGSDGSQSSSSAETSDSDQNEDRESQTKCVTVGQIPLSKRLSIIKNQMHQDM